MRGAPPDPRYPWGATIYGDTGTHKCSVNSCDFISVSGAPVDRDVEYELAQHPEDKTEKDLKQHVASAIRGYMRDLLKVREKRGKPVADVEQGHISSASCILANLSMHLGRSLIWDHAHQCAANDDEANRRVPRPHRSPWVHPEPNQI